MGDPGGVGPEVVVRALAPGGVRERLRGSRFVIHGSSSALHRAAEVARIEPYWWSVDAGSELVDAAAGRDVVLVDWDAWARERGMVASGSAPFRAEPTREGGELSRRWVEACIEMAKAAPGESARVDGIVTAPISKKAWEIAGHKRHAGHTELLAERFGAKRFAMMFEGPRLRVALATVHLPLMDIRDVLTIGRVFDAIDLGAAGCRLLGVHDPKIAVCGLNPHAGEGGLLGDEEGRLIEPAIEVAREHGIDARGPFPADTVFNAAVAGRFDLVVAMYHDQGLIPIKLLDRDRSVNLTVGLPTARTSPDHGTAFDIAGRGLADPGSTEAALEAAVRMLRPRRDVAAGVGGK